MHDALLSWYADHGRHDLPWRQTRDPWAVLVSELMLQQTQVPRVVPKYVAFMERFPTASACAAAPVGEVVKAWAGLGYNRRAVNLHRASSRISTGTVPVEMQLEVWLALPGVGPYTARAVLAFALEHPVCPLDVNTARPLARAFGVTTQDEADALVPRDAVAAWRWNQALMDLGALICTRRNPNCPACPLAKACQWHTARTASCAANAAPYADAPSAAAPCAACAPAASAAAPAAPAPCAATDPAAPANRQSRFQGSDRQGRGRLVDALRDGPVAPPDLAATMGWPTDPARAASSRPHPRRRRPRRTPPRRLVHPPRLTLVAVLPVYRQ